MATDYKNQPRSPIKQITNLNLFSDPQPKTNKRSRLNWATTDKSIMVTIFTNHEEFTKENFAKDGIIRFTIPVDIFGLFIGFMREVTAYPNGKKNHFDKNVEVYDPVKKEVTDKIKAGTIIAGKDGEGVVWFGISVDGKPNIRFKMLPRDTWVIKEEGDVEVGKDRVSRIYTMFIMDALSDICSEVAKTFTIFNQVELDTKPLLTKSGLDDDIPY